MARGSLYDSYQLTNSTAIPLYTGSAAPEALNVGQYLQGLYDTGQTQANTLGAGLSQLTSLPQDRRLADEVRTGIQSQLDQWADSGDYENVVPQVTRLGMDFANRYRELTVPIAQRAKYLEELNNKDLNLTSQQKQALSEMSDQGYTGLQRTASGRLEGTYRGVTPDKNIDPNAKVDTWLKDIAIAEGGSEIINDNGIWKVKKGQKWEVLDPKRIENTIRNAAANDMEYQAFRRMQGNIAGYTASKVNINALPDSPTKTRILQAAQQFGVPPEVAARTIFKDATERGIEESLLQYATQKYARNNVWTESGSEIGQFQIEDYKQKLKDSASGLVPFGDITTGQGIDISTKYGDANALNDKLTQTSGQLSQAETYLEGQRNRVRSATGRSNVTDAEILQWYANNDPQELGRFQDNKSSIESSRSSMREMNQIKDAARDAAVKKSTGNQQTFSQLKTAANKSLNTILGDKSITIIGDDLSLRNLSKQNSDNFEVVGVDLVREKSTGKEYRIPARLRGSGTGSIPVIGSQFSTIGDWKTSYKEGVEGLRSNMAWLPLLNKTTPDGETTKAGAYASRAMGLINAAAASGAVKVKDMNDADLSSKDTEKMRVLIGAGKYNLLGIGVDPNTGERRMSLSVEVDKTAEDPRDRYMNIMVGADTNFWDRISSSVQQAAEDGLKSDNPSERAAALKTLQFGLGLRTGSGYQQAVTKLPGATQYITEKDPVTGNTRTLYSIHTTPTGNSSNALSYKVVNPSTGESQSFNSALDLGAFIDLLRAEGKTLTSESDKYGN